MKKMKRLLALSVALILVCFSATGCNAINEMRARHGYYTETGSIMLGETEYRLLPNNEYFSPIRDNDDEIYVTDKDVPVLLSAMLGVGFDSYNDGLILSSGIYGEDRNYCRADKYEEIAAQMAGEFNPTGYCYTYSAFVTKTETYEERAYLLTEEQKNAVRRILATVEGVERAENAEYTYDHRISLEVCTDNMLLRDWRYDIEVNNGTYYLIENDLYAANGIEYKLPSEYNTFFEEIMAAKVDAEKAEQGYWKEYYGEDFYDEEYYDEDVDYDEDIMVI